MSARRGGLKGGSGGLSGGSGRSGGGSDGPNEILLERAVSAHRERTALGAVLPSPAFFDLAPEQRDALFDVQMTARVLERAADPEGLSTTARAVLALVRGMGQEEP